MIKHLWISAACLLASPLLADASGSVEIKFPPSNYEWRLLLDSDSLYDSYKEYDDGEDLSEKTEEEDLHVEGTFKIFTHREGDALELFSTFVVDEPEDDEDEETDALEAAQQRIDKALNQFFPNHRFILNMLSDDEESGFAAWEFHDGTQDLLHGFTRSFQHTIGEENKIVVLSYMTTAAKTECSRMVWTEVLNQARFRE